MYRLSDKDLAYCLAAEQDFLRRLPAIKAHADKVAERWRDEAEQKVRWALCDW